MTENEEIYIELQECLGRVTAYRDLLGEDSTPYKSAIRRAVTVSKSFNFETFKDLPERAKAVIFEAQNMDGIQ